MVLLMPPGRGSYYFSCAFLAQKRTIQLGKRLGVSKAALVVNEIAEVVATWQDEFKAFAVPESDIESLSVGITGHLTKG